MPELDRLHCLVIKDADTGDVVSCHGSKPEGRFGSLEHGLHLLAEADVIVGHNVIAFDIPAIQKVYPWWKPKGVVRDTIILTRLLWPKEQITDIDHGRRKKNPLCHPTKLIGSYALAAWGYRLGEYKGDYTGGWDSWSQEMQTYCEQDVEVTAKLWQTCADKLAGKDDGQAWGPECVELEHEVAWIVARQERHGFAFDLKKASALYAKLVARRTELEEKLQLAFPPKTIETVFVPKANNKKMGYAKGVPFTKRRVVAFNPGSRKQVAARLMELGWKPTEFTADGTPKVDEEVLTSLPYPQCAPLSEYYMVEKRLGALAEGKEAWLKAERNGRLHGRVFTNGAVTGRMTHSSPNMANVPGLMNRKTGKPQPYGRECRELFTASPGMKLVGCDADALELRCLAHFMAKYDGGAYVQTVLSGKKEEGTDMHSVNAKALGGIPRDPAKLWFYAFIYGAGNWKLGFTLAEGKNLGKQKLIRMGGAARKKFLTGLPAMGKLISSVEQTVKVRSKNNKVPSWLRGLDGRKVYTRAAHAALNTLLQSAGALLMKRALVILDNKLQADGLVPGKDYEFCANVHDEWQIDASPACAEKVGQTAAEAIRLAGEHFAFKCPLAGNFSIGNDWAGTH